MTAKKSPQKTGKNFNEIQGGGKNFSSGHDIHIPLTLNLTIVTSLMNNNLISSDDTINVLIRIFMHGCHSPLITFRNKNIRNSYPSNV